MGPLQNLPPRDPVGDEETASNAISPAERYRLFGYYEPDCLEEDRANFPSLFDDNDWPLFGNCDPYSLTHPLTGLGWYESPRVPRIDEQRADYHIWYELAVKFNNASSTIQQVVRTKRTTPLPVPDHPGSLYKPSARVAATGNLIYLQKQVLPRLRELFKVRDASPEFSLLWGEFMFIIGTLPFSAKEALHRHLRAKGGSEQEKSAQVKWYLHWRRHHCEKLRWSPNRANKEFVRLVRDLASGKRPAPSGFTPEWFKKAAGEHGGLPDTLKRANKDRRAEQLLADSADVEPRIPPITLAAYPKAK